MFDNQRFNCFIEAYSFDKTIATKFSRKITGVSRVIELEPKHIIWLMLESGSFRQALLTDTFIYYQKRLYLRSAFHFNGFDFSLTQDALDSPEKYCLMKTTVEYEGSELYLNPELSYDLSRGERFINSCGHIQMNPMFIFAPGPDEELPEYTRPGIQRWTSSVFSASSEGNANHLYDDACAFAEYMDKVRNLSTDFGKALGTFINESGKSQEEIAYSANISPRNLRRLLLNEHQPKLETVVALCVTLHLFPTFSEHLIKVAGYSLRDTVEGIAYRLIINQMFETDVNTCNGFLKKIGLKPLCQDPFEE